METLRANKSPKFHRKYSKSADRETQHEKVMNQDSPKPQKVLFYYNKTHVQRSTLTPKSDQNDPQMLPKLLQRRPQAPPYGAPEAPSGPPRNEQRTKKEKDPKKQ